MTSSPPIARTVRDLRAQVGLWRGDGETVALVPTLGALHEGHLSLVRLGREKAGRVVASIFVNPTQFAPNEDFEAYPRNEARDAELLAAAGCDLLYAPTAGEMYPPGFSTTVTVAGVSEPLDGQARPHHFAGVATVVAKLLLQAAPDFGIIGEKDYQQLQVIRRLARDLDLAVEIVGGPTARAEDGLALSSRNAYLTEGERKIAPRMHQLLMEAAAALVGGAAVAEVEARGLAGLAQAGFGPIDYFEARNAENLAAVDPGPLSAPTRLLAAAWLGKTRLIDNVGV
ncbi:MAG: panC [Caulobacteraceae bacterium]|nr:panC [Caulobacteraceae bacterium]